MGKVCEQTQKALSYSFGSPGFLERADVSNLRGGTEPAPNKNVFWRQQVAAGLFFFLPQLCQRIVRHNSNLPNVLPVLVYSRPYRSGYSSSRASFSFGQKNIVGLYGYSLLLLVLRGLACSMAVC